MRLIRALGDSLSRLLRHRFEREVIFGCDKDVPLLVRWKLLRTPRFRVCLHIFHRSDEDRELHDHPWSFFSLILWNGYTEVRPRPVTRAIMACSEEAHKRVPLGLEASLHGDAYAYQRRRIYPGSLLYRPARWTHRIEIGPGRPSVSLVVMLRKQREWGFFTKVGWVHWKRFLPSRDCS